LGAVSLHVVDQRYCSLGILNNFANYDATYGSLGAAIGLMMWLWISSIVILVGAELGEIEHQTAKDSMVQGASYSGDTSGGTLSVTDGTHTANIALLGNYLASAFVASSDGHGGTNIIVDRREQEKQANDRENEPRARKPTTPSAVHGSHLGCVTAKRTQNPAWH
jgi:hypothetical protein